MIEEVEIRALTSRPAEIEHAAARWGFNKVATVEQRDIMLDFPDGRLFKGGQKIRIRVEGESAELTFKGAMRANEDVSRRTEINIALAQTDVDSAIALFTALGFPILFQVWKSRTVYKRGDVTLTLDIWPIIGCLIELEGPPDTIKLAAGVVAPRDVFGTFRLKELFDIKARETGRSIAELKREYEQSTGRHLGNIEFLF